MLWPPGQDRALQTKLEAIREAPQELCILRAQLQLRDGSLRQMELRSNAISYDGHNARLLIAIDRTAEDLAQLRRDRALARVEEAHELARIGARELDPSTGLGRYSNQVYRLLGRRPPEARRWHRFDELLVPADPATATQTEQLLAELCSGEPVQVDVLLPVLSMDGRALMVHLRAASGIDEAGRSRVLGTLQDVTEREQSRRLLREREEQFRELVRVLPDGVVILADEHVLYANARAASLFGYGSHTLLGEPLSALVDSADLARVRSQLRAGQLHLGPGHSSVVAMQRADGRSFHAGLAVGEVRYGGRDCKLLIVRDLSDSERIRSALETSNRELQAMAGRLFSLQEDERRAISRDLHDDIGRAITAIKLSAYAAQDEDDPQRRGEDWHRSSAWPIPRWPSCATSLPCCGRRSWTHWAGSGAELAGTGTVPFLAGGAAGRDRAAAAPSRQQHRAGLLPYCPESLTNVLRHARASQVQLQLRDVGQRGLHLQIRDDGEGFDPDGPRGLGLIVMRERAQSVGGHVRIESAHGEGTLIDVHLPTGQPAWPPPSHRTTEPMWNPNQPRSASMMRLIASVPATPSCR